MVKTRVTYAEVSETDFYLKCADPEEEEDTGFLKIRVLPPCHDRAAVNTRRRPASTVAGRSPTQEEDWAAGSYQALQEDGEREQAKDEKSKMCCEFAIHIPMTSINQLTFGKYTLIHIIGTCLA